MDYMGDGEFSARGVQGNEGSTNDGLNGIIEVNWDNGKVIRFNQVDQLVDFLKKVP